MEVELDPDELDDFTPEGIAHALFTQEPKPPCSCQIIAEQQLADLSYIFEILTIILMEGLETLTGNLSQANLANLTEEHFFALNPWFYSLGFELSVQSFDVKDTELYDGHYCRIIVRDKLQEMLFQMKGINKDYHFFLNGPCLDINNQKTELDQLHSIFINGDKVFKIIFKYYVPLATPETKLL